MRKIYIFSFWALLACFVMSCFVKCFNSQPVIVFMGGGSAKNFINGNNKLIDNFPRSFYLNLPSSYSWLSLVEEIEKTKEEGTNRTTIICLSADTIKKEDMDNLLNQHKDIFKTNRFIGLKLGDDPICLYTKDPHKYDKYINNDNSISIDTLIKIIVRTDSKYIYTTKEGSGTFRAYMNFFDRDTDKTTKKGSDTHQTRKDSFNIKGKLGKNIFYGFYNKENFENNRNLDSFIFLGSECYKPNLDGLKRHYIIDSANKVISKPICIYFATYKNKMDLYTISAPVYEFLSHFKEKIDTTVWGKIERRGNWLDEAIKRNKNRLGIIYLNKEEDKF